MRPHATTAVVIALLLALSAVAAVPSADARAPPTPVCGVCSLDRTAPDGTPVTAGDSTLTVSLHENGSTTWRANVELASGSDALAENESFRRAVVEEVTRRSVADPEAIYSRIDGETLIVRYRDTGATESPAGTIVFSPLSPEGPDVPFAMGGEGPRYLGTDRFTLRAPPGYELRGDANAADGGRSLVWTRDGDERTFLDVTDDPVAVDSDAVGPGIRAWVARLLVG
ncbi:hypothetical protein [Halopelagius longus]|uniref:Uncharacterized protein n=1 Tax=Halopelagius longus TaxID=1236180 RepID=A0A1H1G2A6_9EURY|nr:hypothetical protein [Halopelagius longus]RDI69902.1 hypothetical protein DWB78_17295 [Halopelagius longus]SDR06986.1 hypothetical protein SAMN05216278_3456 [Halopelagius longus]